MARRMALPIPCGARIRLSRECVAPSGAPSRRLFGIGPRSSCTWCAKPAGFRLGVVLPPRGAPMPPGGRGARDPEARGRRTGPRPGLSPGAGPPGRSGAASPAPPPDPSRLLRRLAKRPLGGRGDADIGFYSTVCQGNSDADDTSQDIGRTDSLSVMAGLVPAIHVLIFRAEKTWMPATGAGMTAERH
jgi:hypothetical protein